MHTTHTAELSRNETRRAARRIGGVSALGAALCLMLAMPAMAAPGGNNGNGSSNGIGTQGPADSMQMQMQGQGQGQAGQTRGQTSGQMQSQNGTCTSETPTDQAIVGKSLTEAKSMLQGCPWRIGEQDGKAMPTTRDHRADRRTLTIENDKVTSVTRG